MQEQRQPRNSQAFRQKISIFTSVLTVGLTFHLVRKMAVQGFSYQLSFKMAGLLAGALSYLIAEFIIQRQPRTAAWQIGGRLSAIAGAMTGTITGALAGALTRNSDSLADLISPLLIAIITSTSMTYVFNIFNSRNFSDSVNDLEHQLPARGPQPQL